MMGWFMAGLLLLDIAILYGFAFAGSWIVRVFGDWSLYLFVAALGGTVLCLGVGSVTQPVAVRNSKELARDILEELKKESNNG